MGAEPRMCRWGGLRAAGAGYRGEESTRLWSKGHGSIDGSRPLEGPGSDPPSQGVSEVPSVPQILSAAEQGPLVIVFSFAQRCGKGCRVPSLWTRTDTMCNLPNTIPVCSWRPGWGRWGGGAVGAGPWWQRPSRGSPRRPRIYPLVSALLDVSRTAVTPQPTSTSWTPSDNWCQRIITAAKYQPAPSCD